MGILAMDLDELYHELDDAARCRHAGPPSPRPASSG